MGAGAGRRAAEVRVGLIKREGEDGYEMEVASAMGRWTNFNAGSTTGKTHSTSSPTPRMTPRLLPPTATITPDHDYISDDRNDDFDAVHRNHAFDNDFDLDIHEPGD